MENLECATLIRIAEALERISPPPAPTTDLHSAPAFIWESNPPHLRAISELAAVDLPLLQAIDHVRDILLANTRQFAKGLPANHALLWGARGMGKSSLIKAVVRHLQVKEDADLRLVELPREYIADIPLLLRQLGRTPAKIIIYCDDLSFERADEHYKALKTILDGGAEASAQSVLFYATSNRRHMLPRTMMENEQSSAIHPSEAIEEHVSLSDRFGLWLGFHSADQPSYLKMVEHYLDHYGLKTDALDWRAEAIEWAATRGHRSGRVAWHFVRDLAGRMGRRLD